ncbi:poly-beta-1,6 N-acetyl-D-glucosamine export porin PgaA [Citrobacter portucalensis]|uniref:poly-beta-1,6 N-acetyl-D-glucosamine export porin PgaA n=1 Tax=Citrobacter portucalensis TaxID=1639133 RepID=UPI000450DC08|nr:poly-beta-1,6 N-acetyl-D-glucosamine export porin PgaA [Citrobacter portucalensis]ETX62143.1 poly-beta-1,6 N-acetyl-D-glucosamine export porin PgaA [Citrobacter portucalensis]
MFSMRRHANFIKRFKSVSCLFTASILFPMQISAAVSDYDALVIEARGGNSAPLLRYLEDQGKKSALTPNQVADWLQVSGWVENNDKTTIQIWQRYRGQMDVPARGKVAAARAYRNQKNWNDSLAVWESVLQEEPDNVDVRTGWIMTLADARYNQQALTEANKWAQAHPGADSDALLAYVYHSQGKNWDALLVASQADDVDPGNKNAKSTLLSALSANRVSGPALNMAEVVPTADPVKRRLELDAAAEMVRSSYTSARNEEERFIVADKALARYDQLLAAWKDEPSAQNDVRRARIDRMGALLVRKRTAEVIDEYESLSASGEVPNYAKRWVASAWLSERQPEKTEAMLASIYYPNGPIPVTPLSPEDQQDLFYAHIDNENFDAAKKQVDDLIKESPYLRRIYGSPTPQPNDNWLLGQSLLTQYHIAANELPEAEKLAEHLARTGSGNQGLRISYASVLEARGLPHAAEKELKLAEVIEPSNLELERQQAYVALDLQEWKQADELTDDVIARSPDDEATLRLARIRDVHKMSEVRISGTQGISSDSPVSGKNDFNINTAIYSPPINDNWRLFTGFNFATGEFEEGKGISRDLAAGAEWTSRDYWAEMEVSGRNYGDGQKIGGRLSGWHDFNDNWRVGGSAERLSRNTPLRALRSGVYANGGDMFVRWYQNERREYQLSFAASHFSDGNDRIEYGLSGKERMWTTPRFTLDFTPCIGGSTNTKENVPYYNPKSDFSVVPGLSAEQVLYRHYDTVWTQQGLAGVGGYWQQGEDAGAIVQVGYGQRLKWNNVVDGGVMLIWDKRPYDGKRERNISLAFDLNVRF